MRFMSSLKKLPHLVMQLAGEVPPLGLLQLDQAAGEGLELRRRLLGRTAGGPFVFQEPCALCFGALAIGDVQGGADQTDGPPGGVHQNLAAGQDGPDDAAGAADGEFAREGLMIP